MFLAICRISGVGLWTCKRVLDSHLETFLNHTQNVGDYGQSMNLVRSTGSEDDCFDYCDADLDVHGSHCSSDEDPLFFSNDQVVRFY